MHREREIMQNVIIEHCTLSVPLLTGMSDVKKKVKTKSSTVLLYMSDVFVYK